jgi:short-subunit dehydrogenase
VAWLNYAHFARSGTSFRRTAARTEPKSDRLHPDRQEAQVPVTLDDKPTAIVTGFSSDIGMATAEALVRAGYRVFGASRKASTRNIHGIDIVQCDITDDGSVAGAIAKILAEAGRIDVLVNNAGIGLVGAAEETSIAQARQLFEVNLFGLLRVVQAVLPVMRMSGRGRIVNISSAFGFMPARYMALYTAAKHAVEGYTESLDHEVRGFGVRVISVQPANTKIASTDNLTWADKKLDAYSNVRPAIEGMLREIMQTGNSSNVVANTVVRAVHDQKGALRWY